MQHIDLWEAKCKKVLPHCPQCPAFAMFGGAAAWSQGDTGWAFHLSLVEGASKPSGTLPSPYGKD